ncbi:MAG: phage tail tube protein, partial [Clostridia bacterium]
KDSGVMPSMDIQITNEDPISSAGRQTIILKNCLSNGGVITKFDADTQVLTEEITGTFDDWEMPEEFSLISGM